MRVYISGMGIVTSLGNGISNTRDAIQKSLRGIRPLTLFPTASNQPLPVGEAANPIENHDLPRTHQLAQLAADQAMTDAKEAPDAVVMGVTTGGMLTTEYLLKSKASDPKMYRLHATGSVAEVIARRYRCSGPALTVSTACSSGAVALKIALEMLRAGSVRRV
ncbi:MAG: beta-ketoacyl synthase N-terminal-like domain-containing protein, partial [Desulfobacterales bacterium]